MTFRAISILLFLASCGSLMLVAGPPRIRPYAEFDSLYVAVDDGIVLDSNTWQALKSGIRVAIVTRTSFSSMDSIMRTFRHVDTLTHDVWNQTYVLESVSGRRVFGDDVSLASHLLESKITALGPVDSINPDARLQLRHRIVLFQIPDRQTDLDEWLQDDPNRSFFLFRWIATFVFGRARHRFFDTSWVTSEWFTINDVRRR